MVTNQQLFRYVIFVVARYVAVSIKVEQAAKVMLSVNSLRCLPQKIHEQQNKLLNFFIGLGRSGGGCWSQDLKPSTHLLY